MADNAQAQVQREANLARIRDNQRRSRARRKEYLRELEAKLRQCEQMGVEASAEIQAAARKVADENRRLRALLKQQGLSDHDIDVMLAEDTQSPAAAKALDGMIGKRWPCDTRNDCASTSKDVVPAHLVGNKHADKLPQRRPQRLSITPHMGTASPHHPGSYSSGPSSITTSNSQLSMAQPIPYDIAPDYLLSSYDHSFTPPYHYQQLPLAATDSSSCYPTADIFRVISPNSNAELQGGLRSSDSRQCDTPGFEESNVMDRYASR